MKITETRKQIIEILEPYMDKTLSEGCLFQIKFRNVNGSEYVIDDILTCVKLNYDKYQKGYLNTITFLSPFDKNIVTHQIDEIGKIIGHYDITALFKYLENKNQHTLCCFVYENIIKFINNNIIIFHIPNKPLHLYTEEEDKNLLELLKKIGTEKTS